ncbi:MAG TPA: hypothetical protein VN026_04135 [Bacteroidia bacterium]|nr:hypothetical protein [Bacteroidia bacterium]
MEKITFTGKSKNIKNKSHKSIIIKEFSFGIKFCGDGHPDSFKITEVEINKPYDIQKYDSIYFETRTVNDNSIHSISFEIN